MSAIICGEPLAAIRPGDLMPFAKGGERRALLRRVVTANTAHTFRPELNVWDDLVTVILAIHPRRHTPSTSVDVITGWADDLAPVVVGWDAEAVA